MHIREYLGKEHQQAAAVVVCILPRHDSKVNWVRGYCTVKLRRLHDASDVKGETGPAPWSKLDEYRTY